MPTAAPLPSHQGSNAGSPLAQLAFVEHEDELFLYLDGCGHCHCLRCQVQFHQHDSGKLPSYPSGLLSASLTPEGHIFSPGSFSQAITEASNDNVLNLKLQREGD